MRPLSTKGRYAADIDGRYIYISVLSCCSENNEKVSMSVSYVLLLAICTSSPRYLLNLAYDHLDSHLDDHHNTRRYERTLTYVEIRLEFTIHVANGTLAETQRGSRRDLKQQFN